VRPSIYKWGAASTPWAKKNNNKNWAGGLEGGEGEEGRNRAEGGGGTREKTRKKEQNRSVERLKMGVYVGKEREKKEGKEREGSLER